MKICFIWVKKFRNLENFEINFSSTEKFQFDHGNIILKMVNTHPEMINFFGESISDTAGLIGENGSGKSNALELLCKVLKKSKSNIVSDFLIIEKTGEKFICHYSFTDPNFSMAKNLNFKSPNEAIEREIEIEIEIDFLKYTGSIENLKVIFFSNVYDGRQNNFSTDVVDISENKKQTEKNNHNITYDFLMQHMFIESKIFEGLNITTPKNIKISSKLWQSSETLKANDTRSGFIREFKIFMRNRLSDIAKENKFILTTKISIFLEVYSSKLITESVGYKNISEEIQTTFKDSSRSSTVNIIDNLLKILAKHIETPTQVDKKPSRGRKAKSLSLNKYDIERLLDIALKEEFFSKKIQYEYSTEGARLKFSEHFVFDYTNKEFKQFAEKLFFYFESSKYFEIDWIGISSGHKAYLNLFSSIYAELKNNRQGNVLICLDEGDLYLHPKWQIEFIDKILSAIPSMAGSAKVQLILTSHSPFLVSDLPHLALTIFKNNEDSDNNKTNYNIQTFGANLYDLYSSQFFLKNQTISLFASKKIEGWIDEAKNSNLELNKILVEKINLIGHEIIREKLLRGIKNDCN